MGQDPRDPTKPHPPNLEFSELLSEYQSVVDLSYAQIYSLDEQEDEDALMALGLHLVRHDVQNPYNGHRYRIAVVLSRQCLKELGEMIQDALERGAN